MLSNIGEIITDATAYAIVEYALHNKEKLMTLIENSGIFAAADFIYINFLKQYLPNPYITGGYQPYMEAGLYKVIGTGGIMMATKAIIGKGPSYMNILINTGLSQAVKQTINAVIYGSISNSSPSPPPPDTPSDTSTDFAKLRNTILVGVATLVGVAFGFPPIAALGWYGIVNYFDYKITSGIMSK